jgi:hypothetical protein
LRRRPATDSVCNEEGYCCISPHGYRGPVIAKINVLGAADICDSLQGLLEARDLIGLWAFASLDDVEFHFIAFFEGFVAVELDGAVVNEYIRSIITTQETITLRVVEPLHSAFVLCH